MTYNGRISKVQGYNCEDDKELAAIDFLYFVRYSHEIFENEEVPNSSSKFGEVFVPRANLHGHSAHEKTIAPL